MTPRANLAVNSLASINDARELLRDSGYRMPDGRSFDDAFDDEVLSFLEETNIVILLP